MEFDRLKMLIGDNNFNILANSTILVLGLGGVGGSAAINLARCGVGTLIIADFDIVDITNINRQVIAFNKTLGLKKVDVLEKMLLDINKNISVIKYDLFYKEENRDIFFNYNIDYIIDCCDSINSKKLIIKEALNRNIPIISSMGTGNRLNPTKLIITELKNTSYDPLARMLRKWVKDEHILKKIPVLTSTEEPIKTKSKTVGSSAFVTNTAGLLLGYYVVDNLINKK